jgi:hypothetical protein
VRFPANPWSNGVGSGLDEGWLDWMDELAEVEELEIVFEDEVVLVWYAGAAVVESDGAIEVLCAEEEVDDEVVGSSLLLLSSVPKPRRCSASSFVARVHAFGLGGGRRSTSNLPESRGETSALSTICSEI